MFISCFDLDLLKLSIYNVFVTSLWHKQFWSSLKALRLFLFSKIPTQSYLLLLKLDHFDKQIS